MRVGTVRRGKKGRFNHRCTQIDTGGETRITRKHQLRFALKPSLVGHEVTSAGAKAKNIQQSTSTFNSEEGLSQFGVGR
jgi:hypothetical protein